MRQTVVRTSSRLAAGALFLLSGCALYTDVSVAPMPGTIPIERASDIQQTAIRADYLRAYELAKTIEGRTRKSYSDLAALGAAELAGGRYDDARRHLRAALDLEPPREKYASICWDLSQVEYLSNKYATALEWANLAATYGLAIKQWHLQYLEALSNVPVYEFSGRPTDQVPMRAGRPDVPRVDVVIDGKKEVSGIIDSGAVLSIISRSLADSLHTRRLGQGKISGTFYGLLGEPITVEFGMLEKLEIGDIKVANVPVAIMPDDNMSFVVNGKREFKMEFLLGANLLKEFRIILDYRRNRATFTPLQAFDRQPAVDQNLFFNGFRPVVRALVNQKGWFLFVLDTGSEVTYLNDAQMSSLPINAYAPRMHNATLQGLGGAKKRGAKIENVQVGVDRWIGTFKTLPTYSSSEEERAVGIIGENFLQNFIVTLDFGRMRLDLEKR